MSATEEILDKTGTDTALDSVRRLEEKLEDRKGAQEEAESRVASARKEAERIVREAREGAENDAAEHRRATLARADEEAARIIAEAKARAERLLSLAEADRPAAAREIVALILPGREA